LLDTINNFRYTFKLTINFIATRFILDNNHFPIKTIIFQHQQKYSHKKHDAIVSTASFNTKKKKKKINKEDESERDTY
jgi:hypothetical protein